MTSKAVLTLLALAGVTVIAAVLATTTSSNGGGGSGERKKSGVGAAEVGTPVLPQLQGKVNDVAQISVTRASGTVNAQRSAKGWTVQDKGGYPAKTEIVKGLVLGLADLKIQEERTSRPEMYDKLGVEDPKPKAEPEAPGAPDPAVNEPPKPESQAALVTLKDSAGQTLGSVIVGTTKFGQTSGTTGTFVRRAGESQSWLAQGRVDVPRDALGWINTQFANIERQRVRSVTVFPPGGGDEAGTILVSRNTPSEPFVLQNVPPGKQLAEPGSPESLAGLLTYATLADVQPAQNFDFGQARRAVLRTFDELTVEVRSMVQDGKHWWTLAAALDEAAAKAHAEKPGDPSKPDEKPAPEAVNAAIDKAKKEVAELNAQWSGFAVNVPEFKAKPLTSTLEQMLKDVVTAPAQPESPAPVPGGMP